MELRDLLLSATTFRGLTTDDVNSLERSFSVSNYPDGHVFIKEGAIANAIYIVVQGEVAARHKRANQPGQLDIKRIRPGEMFGLHSLIGNRKGKTACVAVGETQVATLPNTSFQLLYEADSPLPHYFQHIVARQLARDYRDLTIAIQHNAVPADEQSEYDDESIEYLRIERRKGTDRRKGDRRKG